MSANLEAVVGAVGIVVFALVFIAGIIILQESDDRETDRP